MRDILVDNGPRKVEKNTKYPLDENWKHFLYNHYSRKMRNGEVRDRKWFVFHEKSVLFLL